MTNSVSIIIPAYNGRNFIEETIDSCLKQSHRNTEVIVIDDGSTDGTRDLLLAYDSRVKLMFNKENLGLVKNVNQGVNHSNSDFFMILGHDDVLPEKHVEIMLSEVSTGIVAVHCNSMLINSSGEEIAFSRNDQTQQEKTKNCLFELSIDNFISSCGMLHKTSTFKSLGGWDETYLHYGEWLYYIKALSLGEIKYTIKTRAYYRRHQTNITNTFKNKEVAKKVNIYKSSCRCLANQNNLNTFNHTLKYKLNNIKLKLKFFYFNLRCVINI